MRQEAIKGAEANFCGGLVRKEIESTNLLKEATSEVQ